ncbi:hypothetical protein [Streptomyces sp. NPDC058751]|uniref:hypothetical protein n=1 Tax=Streptomyces sp. NPDC058751 TaxID=3346623 RepID=UPI00368AD63B
MKARSIHSHTVGAGERTLKPEGVALYRELERTYPKLRDLAAATSTAQTNQMVGYAYGFARAMLAERNLPEARKKLEWMERELARVQPASGEAP